MKPQRSSNPDKLPAQVGWRALLRSGWPLMILPVLSYFWHGHTFGQWGWSLIGLATALGFAAVFWQGILTHTTECNSSVYHRARQPVRYWLTLLVWLGAYALCTASLLWAAKS